MKNTMVISVYPAYIKTNLPEDGYIVLYEKNEVSCSIADLITGRETEQDGWESACADDVLKLYGEADFVFIPWKSAIWKELCKRGIPFVFAVPEGSMGTEMTEFERQQMFAEMGGRSFGVTLENYKDAITTAYDGLSDDLEKRASYKVLLNNVQILQDMMEKLYARKEEYPYLYTISA